MSSIIFERKYGVSSQKLLMTFVISSYLISITTYTTSIWDYALNFGLEEIKIARPKMQRGIASAT